MSYVDEYVLYQLHKLEEERESAMVSLKFHDLELSRAISRRDKVDAAIEELGDFLKERGTEV